MTGQTVDSSSPVKNLFEAATVEEVKERLAQLRPESERQWGKMNPAADAGALLGGDGDGDGEDISAANLAWTAAGAVGEEVVDRERDTDAPQFDDREELPGDG